MDQITVCNLTRQALVRFGERTLDSVAFGALALVRRSHGENVPVPTKHEVQKALRSMKRKGEVRAFATGVPISASTASSCGISSDEG